MTAGLAWNGTAWVPAGGTQGQRLSIESGGVVNWHGPNLAAADSSAIALPLATETLLSSTGSFLTNKSDVLSVQGVLCIVGVVAITAGAATTSVQLRVYRGNMSTGTVISSAPAYTITPNEVRAHVVLSNDLISGWAGTQNFYSLTASVAGGAATATRAWLQASWG